MLANAGDWYWPLWWLLWVAGAVPAVYFAATWRPRERLRLVAIDTAAWVLVLLLLYGRAGIAVAAGADAPSTGGGIVTLVLSGAVAAVLWLRAWHWRRFRRRYRSAS